VKNGAVCVVDIRVVPGYDSNMGGSAGRADSAATAARR
jgi:hypothetical protein